MGIEIRLTLDGAFCGGCGAEINWHEVQNNNDAGGASEREGERSLTAFGFCDAGCGMRNLTLFSGAAFADFGIGIDNGGMDENQEESE